MCTALKYKNVMGRNFDYEKSYDEQIVRIDANEFSNKYKVIGMATGMVQDYPLLYDGMNEHGLCAAGLAFEGNAKYCRYQDDKMNVAAFDVTFWILSNFKTIDEVEKAFESVNIWCEPFSDEFPNSDLHWFVCDQTGSLVIEQTKDGLHIYQSDDVLTNNPSYMEQLEYHRFSMAMIGDADNTLESPGWYSRGRETDGLDGGYSSDERFNKVSYLKQKLEAADHNFNDVTQGFHLLGSVEQVYGVTSVDDLFEYTIYSIVYDMESLKVYIKTYDHLDIGMFKLNDVTLGRYTI